MYNMAGLGMWTQECGRYHLQNDTAQKAPGGHQTVYLDMVKELFGSILLL